jgi:sodium-dependent dicarboxylate transporter 2/3/5
MISCAWGPLIGGITTPAGCGPNPLTMEYLRELAGIDFTFLDWMALGFPAAILMLPCAWGILLFAFPIEKINLKLTKQQLEQKLREIGPVTSRQVLAGVVFLATIFLWVMGRSIEKWTGGSVDYLSISFVAVACACILFVPGMAVLSWKEAEQEIAWGGIILVAAGIALGKAIYSTGAAEWLAWIVFRKLGLLHPAAIVLVTVLGVSLMKVAFSSNTVTGIIVVPLLIALAKNLEINPALVAIPAGITSSLAFLLVTSTPTNVIPYSAGYFSIKDMARAGAYMTVASCVCVTISVCVMGRVLQLFNW